MAPSRLPPGWPHSQEGPDLAVTVAPGFQQGLNALWSDPGRANPSRSLRVYWDCGHPWPHVGPHFGPTGFPDVIVGRGVRRRCKETLRDDGPVPPAARMAAFPVGAKPSSAVAFVVAARRPCGAMNPPRLRPGWPHPQQGPSPRAREILSFRLVGASRSLRPFGLK